MSSVRELTSASPGFEAAVEPEPATSKPTGLKAALPENSVMRHEPAAPWQYAPGTWGEEVSVPFQTLRPGVTLSPEERLSSQLELVKQITSQEGPADGAACLEHVASTALAEGDVEGAKVLYRQMKKEPFASQPRNLVEGSFQREGFRFGIEATIVTGSSETSINPAAFEKDFGSLADVKLTQLEMLGRMKRALGTSVGLNDVVAARAYFDQFAQTHDAKAIGKEFQSYLTAAFVHCGDDVAWAPGSSRHETATLQELVRNQPLDEAGRSIIDCEGYAYLAHAIIGGIENEQGEPRFSMNYAMRPGHVIAVLNDSKSGEGLLVNNGTVTNHRARSEGELLLAVGHELFPKARSQIFGFDPEQGRAIAQIVGLVVPQAIFFELDESGRGMAFRVEQKGADRLNEMASEFFQRVR